MPETMKHLEHLWCLLKSLLAQTFSTSGLCLLVSLYAFVGALIFVQLESQNETIQHERVDNNLKDMLAEVKMDLWINTVHLNILHPDKWMNFTIQRLQKYQNDLFQTFLNEPSYLSSNQWSFSGALLYSITVITTIGYGNVTCRTLSGRIATMFYAILGIPLTFLCLTNLGTLMANTFRFIYRKILCCTTNSNSKIQVPILVVLALVFVYIALGAFLFSIWENWNLIDGAYFCFTTLTTIGFGDFVPGTAKFNEYEWNSGNGHYKFIACSAYMLFGLALIAMCFNLVQEEAVHRCKKIATRIGLFKSDSL